jgi:hypothetical protein
VNRGHPFRHFGKLGCSPLDHNRAGINQRLRRYDLAALRSEAQESAAWRNTVRNAIAYQQRQTLLNELEAAMTPPPSPPEPTVVYVEADEGSDQLGTSDFDASAWMKKSRSWW